MPVNANSFNAVEPLGLGAIALLSRSPAGRRRVRSQHPNLAALAGDLAPYHERAHFLEIILNVLDDERILVLHPEERKGFRIRIGGIPVGFLGVYGTRPRQFEAGAVNFVQSIANIVGVALERREAEERLAHRALHDALCDLPNRILMKGRK